MKDQLESIREKLLKRPDLMDRIESILDIASDTDDQLKTADAAEERTRTELQKLGKELLEQWTQGKNDKHSLELESSETNRKYRKKNSTGRVSSVRLK